MGTAMWLRVFAFVYAFAGAAEDCDTACDTPPSASQEAASAMCNTLGDAQLDCELGFSVGYYISCLAKCNDGYVDAAALKDNDVKGPSCNEQPNKAACSKGFDQGIDAGAGVESESETTVSSNEQTCASKCDDSDRTGALAHHCRQFTSAEDEVSCTIGGDVGYMLACLAVCEGTGDVTTLKGDEVRGSTCEEQSKKAACASGFDKGVELGAGVQQGEATIPESSCEKRYSFVFQEKPLGITVTGKNPVTVKRMKRDCNKDPVCIGVGDQVLSVQGRDFSHAEWKQVMDHVKTLSMPFEMTFCRSLNCDKSCDEQSQDRKDAMSSHCIKFTDAESHVSCELGFDVGYYISCLAKCDAGGMDVEALKGEEVKGPTCNVQSNQQACSSGFEKGVEVGAAKSIGNQKLKPSKPQLQPQRKNPAAEASSAVKSAQQTTPPPKPPKPAVAELQSGAKESSFQQEQAAKEAERAARMKAEELARVKWMKEEEERELAAEREEEEERKRQETARRKNAQAKRSNKEKLRKQQVTEDKRKADEYAAEEKAKKKRKKMLERQGRGAEL